MKHESAIETTVETAAELTAGVLTDQAPAYDAGAPPPSTFVRLEEMPVRERPRERLLRQGPESLSDAELLAVLLRTGGRTGPVLEVSRNLLSGSRSLVDVLEDPGRLLELPGIGPAKAASLLAAREMSCRLRRSEVEDRDLLDHPEAVADYLWLRYGRVSQEVVGVLHLNVRYRLMEDREVYRGTLCRTLVEPATILRQALERKAHSVLLFHTHPSGDPSPSTEDLLFTERLRKASEIVGVGLADHLIVGHGGRWVSLKRRGNW